MSTGTVHLHRVLRAPPERVYRAFVEPSAMVKWLPPHGYTAEVHHMDVRVGGGVRMSFTHFASGQRHSFGGDYLELVPGKRLRYTDTFDDPNLPGQMNITITFRHMASSDALPSESARRTKHMSGSAPPMTTTVTLRPVACGTELSIVQEGIPEMIPVEMCHLGWQESLALLSLLVEAEVPSEAG